MAGRPKKYTAKEVADALYQAGGIKKRACKILGCSYPTLYRYIDEYSTVEEAAKEGINMIRGEAENCVRESIRGGDVNTSKWFLAKFDEDYKDEPKQIDITSDGDRIDFAGGADINIVTTEAADIFDDEEEGEEQ